MPRPKKGHTGTTPPKKKASSKKGSAPAKKPSSKSVVGSRSIHIKTHKKETGELLRSGILQHIARTTRARKDGGTYYSYRAVAKDANQKELSKLISEEEAQKYIGMGIEVIEAVPKSPRARKVKPVNLRKGLKFGSAGRAEDYIVRKTKACQKQCIRTCDDRAEGMQDLLISSSPPHEVFDAFRAEGYMNAREYSNMVAARKEAAAAARKKARSKSSSSSVSGSRSSSSSSSKSKSAPSKEKKKKAAAKNKATAAGKKKAAEAKLEKLQKGVAKRQSGKKKATKKKAAKKV